jgi:uncharacterized DUF497 family protein
MFMKFTLDAHKCLSNLKRHKLDFADAAQVFQGPMRIFEDNRFDYGEQR